MVTPPVEHSADRKSRMLRRVAPALATLIIAVSLWLFLEGRAPARDTAAEGFVGLLVARAETNEQAPIAGTEAVIATTVRTKLAALSREAATRNTVPSFDIARGDTSAFGDGNATHTATIFVERKPRLILRLHSASGPVTVIGVVVPEEGSS
jgi:hypothetical protein